MSTSLMPGIAATKAATNPVTPEILVLQFTTVNACILGDQCSRSGKWFLVDTALPNSACFIRRTAAEYFFWKPQPQAIILTHGHYDHVGSVIELAERWDVPVYAHPLELPYLTGAADYPPDDPRMDDSLTSELSTPFPRHGIDLGSRVEALPADGQVPGLSDWEVIHTPGHTPGHISLFHHPDRVLIAGDAITTAPQESAAAVLNRTIDPGGLLTNSTTDWENAEESTQRLSNLEPSLIILGHGQPLPGNGLRNRRLSQVANFAATAMPEHLRFVP